MGVAGSGVEAGLAAEVAKPPQRTAYPALVQVPSGLPDVAKLNDRLMTLSVSWMRRAD